jgi:uncharacterized protein (DUF2267 family)
VPLRSFREFAFVMVAGVLIDTFVVRSMLVPALTALAGEKAWWSGRRVKGMTERELVERVARRAGVGLVEANRATHAALSTLAERITSRESKVLAAQLPRGLAGDVRRAARRPERFAADEFVRRVGRREGVSVDEAREHARAVLATLEDTSPDRLAYVRAQLSPDYEELFRGRADGGAPAPTDRAERRD